MSNVYTNTIVEWCIDKTQNTDSVTAVITAVSDYVKEHNLPVVEITKQDIQALIDEITSRPDWPAAYIPETEMIKGIHFYNIMGDGTYFEMLPGVWRPIIKDRHCYNMWESFCSAEVFVKPTNHEEFARDFIQIYGMDIYDACCYIQEQRRGCFTLYGLIDVLQYAVSYLSLNKEEVDITYFDDRGCVVEPLIPFSHTQVLYPETYFNVSDNIWRLTVHSVRELSDYYDKLYKQGLLFDV